MYLNELIICWLVHLVIVDVNSILAYSKHKVGVFIFGFLFDGMCDNTILAGQIDCDERLL